MGRIALLYIRIRFALAYIKESSNTVLIPYWDYLLYIRIRFRIA